MKNTKRFLTLALALTLVSSMMFACKKNDAPAPANEEQKTEAAADAKDTMDEKDNDDHDHDHDNDHEEAPTAEDVSLEMWAGDWNSINAYYDDPVVKEAIEKKAKEEGMSADDYIKGIEERRATDYKGLHIEGNTITFYDGKIGEGNEIAKAEYKLADTIEVPHGNKTLNWFVFETDSKDVKKYMALMQIHGEEHLAHYHTRYTDNLDDIKDQDSKWFPTYIRTSVDSQDIAEELTE